MRKEFNVTFDFSKKRRDLTNCGTQLGSMQGTTNCGTQLGSMPGTTNCETQLDSIEPQWIEWNGKRIFEVMV